MAYPVSSGVSASAPAPVSASAPGSLGMNTVSMQTTYGILVRPCSSHYVADEVVGEGESKSEGDVCMDVPFDFDFGQDEENDDDDEEEEEEEECNNEDSDEEESDEEEEDNTRTGLAISVPITSIQPGSGPSLKDIKPKARSKRFKRDLISMPVQYLRLKWRRSMALRYIQKRAADTAAASVTASAVPHRPQIFNNNGFGSWYAPLPVQMQTQTQTQTQGHGQRQSPKYDPWDPSCLPHYRATGGFT